MTHLRTLPDDFPAASPGPARGSVRLNLPLNIAIQIAGWLIGLALVYGSVNTRVSVLEFNKGETDRRLQSIESKVDILLRRP